MELAAAKQQVGRQKVTRSRNGCKRCKLKRFKCGEEKPSCLQCTSRAVACPGYAKEPLQWSTKHEIFLHEVPQNLLRSPDTQRTAGSNPSKKRMLDPNPRNPRGHDDPVSSSSAAQRLPTQMEDSILSNAIPLSLLSSEHPIIGQTPPTTPEEEQATLIPSLSPKNSPIVSSSSLSNEVYLAVSNYSSFFEDQSTARMAQHQGLLAIQQRFQHSSIPEHLVHMPTVLIDHYFDYVCTIFSTFDSARNPFRSTVGRVWTGYAPIYFTIQSMAAAYLANDFPYMRPVGLQLQQEAYKRLQQEFQSASLNPGSNDKMLMTVLLLGLTTSWHRSDDLGLEHQRTARRLFQRRIEQQGDHIDPQTRRENRFFEQCLLYWKMLSALVTSTPDLEFLETSQIYSTPAAAESTNMSSMEEDVENILIPHPWTGVVPKVLALFTQVAALIRQTRFVLPVSLDFLSLNTESELIILEEALEEALPTAEFLEEELLSFQSPSADNVADTGDERTPVDHFVTIGELYRYSALLLIYRIWPSILGKRLSFERVDDDVQNWEWPGLGFQPEIEVTSGQVSMRRALAIHVLSKLEDLPSSTGTRFLQPVLLLVLANELCFSNSVRPFGPLGNAYTPISSINVHEIGVARARRFVISRMNELQTVLPSKPQEQVLKVIKETWRRLDEGIDSFWLDIMIEKGWGTIMG